MKKNKILIIEDEQDLAEMVKEQLEKNGYQADVALTAEEALIKIKDSKPDLITLDLKLPGMDGYGFCETLRSDERYKDLPIIMLTARDSEIEKKAGFAAGANEYLFKPYDPKVLVSTIKKHLA